MYKLKTFTCVMPARSGSKGIRYKNVLELGGEPMMAWPLLAAKKSGVFDHITVSTDCTHIAAIGLRYGADDWIARPAELAGDDSPVALTMVHATSKCVFTDYVMLLQATSPLILPEDISNAADMLLDDPNVDMIISVSEANPYMALARPLPADNSLRNFIPKELRQKNRQDWPKCYYPNGAVYMGKWEIFQNNLDYYEQNTVAYIMPPERSIDINEPADRVLADHLLAQRKQCNAKKSLSAVL